MGKNNDDRVIFGKGKKFDMQFEQGLIAERGLADIITNGKIEMKRESYYWEWKKRICIEYRHGNEWSGVLATEAATWAHQLVRDGEVLLTLMIPVKRLRKLCKMAQADGDLHRVGRGDKGLSSVIYLPIEWLYTK
jgi:hypothetical protein